MLPRLFSNPLANRTHLFPGFAPDWYLEKNPDVRKAGVDAANHYVKHGWKEGRDPSPMFSTNYYLQQNNIDRSIIEDPLSHYFKVGRKKSLPIHPDVEDMRISDVHIGIVSVSYNCSDISILTLKSIFAARKSVRVTYFLVDGGSSNVEKDKIRKFLKTRITSEILVEFIDLDENLGYSGGNNIGIRRALDMGCSHICLLNPDVVVTDFWLERLLDCGELFVSPVSNSVGNEQTVPINYHVERNETSFDSVNRFARKWAQAFHKCSTPADFLGFFCVLINRKVFDRVGPLDERFFPGGFENIDYCIRARKAGFNLAIARHVYLHHWGSASFSNLPMSKRRHYISVNRTRLEKKHSFFWVDWKYTVILSATCDMYRAKRLFSPSLRSFQRDILSRHRQTCLDISRELAADGQRLLVTQGNLKKALSTAKKANYELIGRIGELYPHYEALNKYRFCPQLPVSANSPTGARRVFFADRVTKHHEIYSSLYYLCAQELVAVHRPFFEAMRCLLPAIEALSDFLTRQPIVVLSGAEDPINSDEKDGYVQRVIAIDKLMTDRERIYLRSSPGCDEIHLLQTHTDGIATLDINLGEPVGRALCHAVTKYASLLYAHSIASFGSDVLRQDFSAAPGRKILDIHGAAPEEAAMYGSQVNCAAFTRHEAAALAAADKIVCVSKAMGRHLSEKHGVEREKFIYCPIFTNYGDSAKSDAGGSLPMLVYAGGTQLWQRIPEMVDAILAVSHRVDYRILTPNPEKVRGLLIRGGVSLTEANSKVYSASHDEVIDVYRQSHYGFLLREKSVVNTVACPTKLIEYLSFGIVPILKTPYVGDFVDLGMQWLSIDEVKENGPCDEARRIEIVENNFTVIQKIDQQSKFGKGVLRELFK